MNKVYKLQNTTIVLLILCMLVSCMTGCGNQQTQKNKEYTNIFEYMFSLEDEEYAYTPQGLAFGMSDEEVIKAEALTDYTIDDFGNITYTKTVTDVSEDIKELTISKYYQFTEGYGLYQVEYRVRVSKDDVDAFLNILKEQSKEYMPTGMEDNKSEVIWGEKVSFEMAKDLTSGWKTREANRSFAAFNGDYVLEDGTEDHIIQFTVGNGDSYWEFYNLFYDNFFAYAIKLDNEEYTYDFGKEDLFFRFRYGDDMQRVITGHDMLYVNIEQATDTVSMSMAFKNMPSEIKEYTFAKNFVFDTSSKLTGVEYTLAVNSEEFETLCDMLFEQAANYMPKATEGAVEDIKKGNAVSWSTKDASGKANSRVELTFADSEDGRKAVTLAIYIEE